MAAKKKPSRTVFLTDPEIRELEQMDDGQISVHFMQLGVQNASQVVRAMIASYRITARVANAGWKLLQALNQDDEGMKEVLSWLATNTAAREALLELRSALTDYSPGNWPPPRTEREYAMHILEKLYETATRRPSWESALESIYQAVEAEYEEIHKS